VARLFYLLVLVVLVGAVAVFAYQNAGPADLRFLNWTASAPVAAVAGAAYLLGMLSGWTVVGIFRRSVSRVTAERSERR
jgi:lipopolysaccharide assembly protein A